MNKKTSKKLNKLIKFKMLIFFIAIATTLQINTQFYKNIHNTRIANTRNSSSRFSRSSRTNSKANSRTKINSKCDISYYESKQPRCSACCYYPYYSYQYYPYSNFTWWR